MRAKDRTNNCIERFEAIPEAGHNEKIEQCKQTLVADLQPAGEMKKITW